MTGQPLHMTLAARWALPWTNSASGSAAAHRPWPRQSTTHSAALVAFEITVMSSPSFRRPGRELVVPVRALPLRVSRQ